ncbi:hypothetical protein IscW_ISCW009745, partial [Ixodes scapularis]
RGPGAAEDAVFSLPTRRSQSRCSDETGPTCLHPTPGPSFSILRATPPPPAPFKAPQPPSHRPRRRPPALRALLHQWTSRTFL